MRYINTFRKGIYWKVFWIELFITCHCSRQPGSGCRAKLKVLFSVAAAKFGVRPVKMTKVDLIVIAILLVIIYYGCGIIVSLWIIGSVIILFLIILIVTRSQKYIRKLEEESKFWPSVEGRIIKAKVIYKTEDAAPSLPGSYTPKIKYKYCVNGKVYYSTKICYGYNPIYHCNSCQECEEKHKDLLTINNTVEVFFCFFNPSTSVLIPGYFYDSFSDSLCGKDENI